jgi:hypothetical protein
MLAAMGYAKSEAGAQDARRAPLITTVQPDWTMRWSPLSAIGDLPRELPRAASLPGLLLEPRRSIGAFWTAGNPAALVNDLQSDFASASLERAGVDGEYRRPLDPAEAARTVASAEGRKILNARQAAIGRASLESETLGLATGLAVFDPYRGSPLVPTDTSSPDTRRTRVMLEGAASQRLNGWQVGISAGYVARQSRSEQTTFGRILRDATSAVSAGVVRQLRSEGALALGVHARWAGAAETVTMVNQGTSGEAYQLEGYSEVIGRPINVDAYRRRIERTGTAFGASLSGRTLGADWVLAAERQRLREEQSTQQSRNPPIDRWATDGMALRAALHREVAPIGAVLILDGEYASLDGDAERNDLTGRIFLSEESAFAGSAELRRVGVGLWGGALRFGLRREARNRYDGLEDLRTDVIAWMPQGALEITRVVGPRLTISLAAALAQHAPEVTIPAPTELGPVYQRLFAPEMAVYATPATARALGATAAWRTGTSSRIWMSLRHDALSPGDSQSRVLAGLEGDRRWTTFAAGVTVERRTPVP